MKANLPVVLSTIAAALVPLFSAQAQTTATTDPVGFITLNVAGGGTPAHPVLSLISPTLLNPVVWQGAVTVSGTTITAASGTPWTAGQFNTTSGINPYFVEVVTGTTPGAYSDITSNTTSAVTTHDNLSAFAGASPTVRIRQHVTIANLFGATNSAGLQISTTGDPSAADEVLIYSGASSVSVYYYDNGLNDGSAGWYDESSGSNAANYTIAPNEGIVIKRKVAAPLSIVSFGAPKTGNTLLATQHGLNVIGTVNAVGLTLDTSGLYTGNSATGLTASVSGDPTAGDEVVLYSGTSQTNFYYYNNGLNDGSAGWYNEGAGTLAGSTPLVPGTSLVVKRNFGSAFNWVAPSPTSF